MRKIFVLEDDDGIREVLELILTSENYLVETFSSVAEFMSRDIEVEPDLFLFDVRLPDGSGLEVLKSLRKIEKNGSVPAIVMSAHADFDDLEGICDQEDFISKPFDINVLLSRIKGLIDKHSNSV